MYSSIEWAFERIGVRARIRMIPNSVARRDPQGRPPITVSLSTDREGFYFSIVHRWRVKVDAPDVIVADRHVLLVAEHDGIGADRYDRFLCGWDERSWFVAAVPEASFANTVQDAKDALKPPEVWESMKEHNVPMELRDNRWTDAFVRQGEWFFLPRPWLDVDDQSVLPNEAIHRGTGRPHVCEFLYRLGGERVFVSNEYPEGLTAKEYSQLDPFERRRLSWREAMRDASVFARGRISHPDHQTIVLPYWHKVVMNTESKARALQHVRFID